MNSPPNARVTVLTSVYNDDPRWLKQSIESILAQSYTDFQYLIVLNNPGAHDLRELIRSYARQDPRIRMLDNPKHLSLAASLNAALSEVQGQFIARMDADDISDSRRLAEQVRFLDSNEDISLVGSNVTVIDEDDQVIGALRRPHSCRNIARYHRMAIGSCVLHPTWFARRTLFEELSGYREAVTLAEDYDFLLRGAARGHRYANLRDNLLKYRIRQGLSIENFRLQMEQARWLRRQYLDRTILDDDSVERGIKELEAIDTWSDDESSKAIRLLYEASREKSDGRAFSYLKKMLSAFRLSPAVTFDIAVRNTLLNRLLSRS